MNPVSRRHLVPLCVALLALLLQACAGPRAPVRSYVAPSSGPTAKLLTRGSVRLGDVYGVIVFDDAERCGTPRLAGAGTSARPPKATQLEGDRLSTVEFVGVRGDKTSCRIRWSFTPASGKTYLVSGLMSEFGCSARVLDATDPDRIKPVASAQRRNVGSNACTALKLPGAATAATEAEQASGEAVLRPGASADDLEGLIGP